MLSARLVLKMDVIDLDLQGNFGHFDWEFWLVLKMAVIDLGLQGHFSHFDSEF